MIESILIIGNYCFEPILLRHMVHRLYADYQTQRIHIYCNSVVSEHFSSSGALEDLQNDIVTEMGSGTPGLIFRLTPDELFPNIPFRLTIRGPQVSLKIDERKSQLLDVDLFGRTVPFDQTQADLINASRPTRFMKVAVNEKKFYANFSYFPLFPLCKNPAEVGTGALAKYEISEFGTRIVKGERIARESPAEFLVVLYGGSGSYSTYNSLGQSAGKILERKLQEYFDKANPEIKVRCLNLAQPGHTVQEAIALQAYVANQLKPNAVILNIGYNDSRSASHTDEVLRDRGISFSSHYKNLHYADNYVQLKGDEKNRDDIYRSEDKSVDISTSTTLKAINSFIMTADGNADHVLVSVQPSIFNKHLHSGFEKKYLKNKITKAAHSLPDEEFICRTMLELEAALPSAVPDNVDILQCNQRLKLGQSEETYFWDQVHLSPAGEEWLAEQYYQGVISRLKEQGR